jgi:glycosyltransferase involved in cell wall biosynthesis
MRISLNIRRIDGPYGGGSRFADGLERHLREAGHDVCRELVPGLDVILIVSSKPNPVTTAYTDEDTADYLACVPDAVVVHRINTCDEPRGRDLGANRAMLRVNRIADHTVYVSEFVRQLFLGHGIDGDKPWSVILNAADETLFHTRGRAEWSPGEKLRLVTHHWSNNPLKGFDVYKQLDRMLAEAPWRERFEFTCIGNLPDDVAFENSRHVPVLDGAALADEIRSHHVYLTAARHEPGGNHYIEGMRCGLPVLYLDSGSLPEYCAPYGHSFTLDDFGARLTEMGGRYAELREAVLVCPFGAKAMAERYVALFEGLVAGQRANPRPRRQKGLSDGLQHLMNLFRKRARHG